MLSQQVRRGLGMLFLICGLILLAWGAWPAGSTSKELTLFPQEMQLLEAGNGYSQISEVAGVPAVLEVRNLTLEAPVLLRIGEQGLVRLSFVPRPVMPELADSGELKDIFDTHQVTVEARLEVGGLEVTPQGTLARSLVPAQPVTFEWIIFPHQPEAYEGTVWFYLRFLPKDGSPGTSRPVSAQQLVIRPTSFFGLAGSHARMAGGMGALIGLMLAVEWLAPWNRRLT